MWQKVLPNHLLHSRKQFPHIRDYVLYKYPLWLDCVYYCGVTLLGIFPRGFSDRAKILLPHQRALCQPISFVIVVPDIIAKIMRAYAHLKPVTCAEQFSGLNILWMHYQYAFLWFGILTVSQALSC